MLTDYQKYQLEWMIVHGYSLQDLINKLAEITNEVLTVNGNAHVFMDEAFDILEKEIGFVGAEIWACDDEWEMNENDCDDDDFKTNFEIATEMLKENPYDFNKHKDFVCLFCSEQETPFDESTLYEFYFFVEKDWLQQYVLESYDLKNLQEWINEAYTSDESEDVLFDGIEDGVVVGVYK